MLVMAGNLFLLFETSFPHVVRIWWYKVTAVRTSEQQSFRKEFLLVSSYLNGFGGWWKYFAQINCHPEIPWISRCVGSLRSFLLSSYSKHCRMLIVNVVIVCETNSWVVSRFDVICIRFSNETYEQHQPPYDGLLAGKGEPTLQWNIISCKGWFLKNYTNHPFELVCYPAV